MKANQLLTSREAATELHISVATIRRLLRKGTLKGIKVGDRRWHIPGSELRKWIEPAATNPDPRRSLEGRSAVIAGIRIELWQEGEQYCYAVFDSLSRHLYQQGSLTITGEGGHTSAEHPALKRALSIANQLDPHANWNAATWQTDVTESWHERTPD